MQKMFVLYKATDETCSLTLVWRRVRRTDRCASHFIIIMADKIQSQIKSMRYLDRITLQILTTIILLLTRRSRVMNLNLIKH